MRHEIDEAGNQVRILVDGYHYSRERILKDAMREAFVSQDSMAVDLVCSVGPDWGIWNAPRPLYGHHHWTGPFLSGVHYVAIDPHGDYADDYREESRKLDGRLLRWVTWDDVLEKVRWYYAALIEDDDIVLDDFSERDIVTTYYRVKDKEEPYEIRKPKGGE